MCTLVKTRDVGIVLDAGVALGPRFRLMPHPDEYRARDEARRRIEEAAADSQVITISHYHNDHHTPNFDDPVWLGSNAGSLERIYKGKIVLVKDSRRKINTAQRRRGWMFRQSAEKIAGKFETADGRDFEFGRTKVRFSPPVPHGEDESGLGWVLVCIVERGKEKMMFAPDVQGPVVEETVKLVLDENPDLLIMGGPPTYLKGFKVAEEFFQLAVHNMGQIVRKIPTVVVDHHLLRDEGWHSYLEPVRKNASNSGHRVITAAELAGRQPRPLECIRQNLYENNKPSDEFLKWAKLPKEKQSLAPPPL